MSLVYDEKQARIAAYHLAYQSAYLGAMPLTSEYYLTQIKINSYFYPYITNVLTLIKNNQADIDAQLNDALLNWKTKRMEPIVTTTLRVATVELLHLPKPLFKVIINEAVDFLKKFSNLKSAKMANAVLNKLWLEAKKK